MAPRSRRAAAAAGAAVAAGGRGGAADAPSLLPDLPEACWSLVFEFLMEMDYKSFYRGGLVCRRFRDIVRHSTILEGCGFAWNEEEPSHTRAHLFMGWLAGRLGRPLSSLDLALTPPPAKAAHVTSEFRASFWCALGLLAPQITELRLETNCRILTAVDPWIGGFSKLTGLSLIVRGSGVDVRASLAKLPLSSLLISCAGAIQWGSNALFNGQAALAEAELEGIGLTFAAAPRSWLPSGLRYLSLECPTLRSLPQCITCLGKLDHLHLRSLCQLSNCHLIEQVNAGLEGLVLDGSVPAAFVPRLAVFSQLSHLHLQRIDLGGARAGLRRALQPMTGLVSLRLCDMGLAEMSAIGAPLAELDLSHNGNLHQLPPGSWAATCQRLATSWRALAGSIGKLSNLDNLEEICVEEQAANAEELADVLRALAALPKLTVLYWELGPALTASSQLLLAMADLARARPALQFKQLADCTW